MLTNKNEVSSTGFTQDLHSPDTIC